MFNRVRNKIRYLTIGIGTVIIIVAFFTVYFISRANIINTSRSSLQQAVEIIIDNPGEDRYKETEVMIFKIEDEVIQYNDNYKRYNKQLLKDLYSECEKAESDLINLGSYYFYYMIVNLNGENLYCVYDASLAMENFYIMSITLTCLFIILIILIVLVACYFSNQIVNPLEKTYVKQKEFIQNASHELKTPLTIVNASLDSLTSLSKTNQHWIDNAKSQTDRMNKLIVEMLELFRIENQTNNLDKVIDLSNYLRKTILSFEVLTYEKKIKFEEQIEDSIMIKANENNIDKMINILLDNALKYVSVNGYIKIELKKDKKKILFMVENSGCDLEKEDMDHIFERFYKKNQDDKSSFGLGLAILKAIVDNLNGEIRIDSKKGEYTRFIIKL